MGGVHNVLGGLVSSDIGKSTNHTRTLLLVNYFTVCAYFYFIFLRNLLFLKNYSGNVEDLSLNFTVVNNDLGESQVTKSKQPNPTTPSHM